MSDKTKLIFCLLLIKSNCSHSKANHRSPAKKVSKHLDSVCINLNDNKLPLVILVIVAIKTT